MGHARGEIVMASLMGPWLEGRHTDRAYMGSSTHWTDRHSSIGGGDTTPNVYLVWCI